MSFKTSHFAKFLNLFWPKISWVRQSASPLPLFIHTLYINSQMKINTYSNITYPCCGLRANGGRSAVCQCTKPLQLLGFRSRGLCTFEYWPDHPFAPITPSVTRWKLKNGFRKLVPRVGWWDFRFIFAAWWAISVWHAAPGTMSWHMLWSSPL